MKKFTSFAEFLIKENNSVFFTFGRCNPPTRGHEKLFDKLVNEAKRNPYKIFLSPTQDSKKNPLLYEDKIKYTRKMFPNYGRAIIENRDIKNILHAAVYLFNEGYNKINLVVGEDRKEEFDTLLNKYNNKNMNHGYYVFEEINVISAGIRDPDANDIKGVSSSKLREAAAKNNFTIFSQGLTKSILTEEAKKIFNDVRLGLGLDIQKSFKNHIALKPISETREKYIQGNLFEKNDEVVIKESDEVCTITMLGTNYVIVETSDGTRLRKWLTDVEKI